jgi:HSP20 family protein
MAIIRFADRPSSRGPWTEFERLRQELDKWTRAFTPEETGYSSASVYPALNVTEDANNIYVDAEIPGAKAADPEIFIEGDTLTIKGERKRPAVGEKTSYHRREIDYGRYNRAITLPTKINPEKIAAKAANGILFITLPKAEEAKPKKIAVSVE